MAATLCSNILWILPVFLGFISSNHAQGLIYAGVLTEPFLFKDASGNPKGFIPDILSEMQTELNIPYINYTYEPFYGSMDADGNWTGMMKSLVNDEVDIAGLLTITKTRGEYVSFTHPVYADTPVMVMKKPTEETPPIKESLTRLLTPLEFPVWLMTILAFLVTSTVVYIISHFNPYEWRRMAKDKEATLREAESFTCINSFWFVISSMAWQGYIRAPRSMGGRITVTAWWFFVIIFILSYTASLTNYLRAGTSSLETKTPVNSFSDLAKSDMNVFVVPYGKTEKTFKDSLLPTYNAIYQKIVETRNEHGLLDSAESLEFIRKQAYSDSAFIMEGVQARYLVNQKSCDLYMVRPMSVSSYNAFAVQTKNTALLTSVNGFLRKFEESGKLGLLENKWFKVMCSAAVFDTSRDKAEPEYFQQLNLGTFSGALLILAFGIILGGVVSIVEFCIYKFAEAHPDEEETANADLEGEQNDVLIKDESKRGGATQV